jgi:putative acetyltransferase
MIIIRDEEPGDIKSIFEVNSRAFETDTEARLVNTLRGEGVRMISLVAEMGGMVAGHILFTPVITENQGTSIAAGGLGPMAVLPEYQRSGLGSILISAGLGACRTIGWKAVFVLGHPEYYPKFGFVPTASFGLRYKRAEFDPFFFVKELELGALAGISGMVNYHPAFDNV